MMQIILVAAFLIAVATMACASPAATLESDSASSSQQPEDPGSALLLDERSAISILQSYLHDCLLDWDETHAFRVANGMRMATQTAYFRGSGRYASMLTPTPTFVPPPPEQLPASEQEKKSWLMDMAIGTAGSIIWSAQYYGTTQLGRTEAETWIVIGPGLQITESQLAAPGRWKVYAGHQGAHYLDAPARLALEEYDSYDSCP